LADDVSSPETQICALAIPSRKGAFFMHFYALKRRAGSSHELGRAVALAER
jgi:hypothetical protein